MAGPRKRAGSKATGKRKPSPGASLSSREDAVAAREESLRAREETAAQAWLKLQTVMGDLQEANEHLVVANIRSLALAQELAQLYEEATSTIQAKDDFFAQVSHELRNPLTSISGWAHLLEKNPNPATITEAARSIAKSAAIQAQLVNDLLDVSRIMAARFAISIAEIDFLTVVDDAATALRPVAAAKNVSLQMTAEHSIVVAGDATRLRQVVDNLFSNAVKFTPAGGVIDVSLTMDGSHAVFELSDTGEGIPPHFLPRVFERHAQADASSGGLGLGLAIVKYIVELHGGSVEAASEGVGKGAKFTVRIPTVEHE